MSAADIRRLVIEGASDADILAYVRTAFSVRTPMIPNIAPDFVAPAVVNKEFREITLSQFRGKWVVLFFYPLDFTFVCPTEIIAFSDRVAEFEAINAQPIACSCDSKFSHLAWVNTPRTEGGLGEMKIPIVADFQKLIASAYGVLLPDGPDAGVTLRGLFIIDPAGKVRQMTVNDLPVGRSVDETLRLIKAFQFNELHGEVCPANWQPGDATMVADPSKSKAYFSSAPASLVAETEGGVRSLTTKAEFDSLVSSTGPVVVDYWAPWCRNCKKISPFVDRLAADLPGVTFAKVNTTELEDLAAHQGVEVLPTFQIYKAGVKVTSLTGSDPAALEQAVRAVL